MWRLPLLQRVINQKYVRQQTSKQAFLLTRQTANKGSHVVVQKKIQSKSSLIVMAEGMDPSDVVSTKQTPSEPFNSDATNLDFENHKECFKDKSTWEIFRGLAVLKICGFSVIADNSLKIFSVTKVFFPKSIFEKMLKATFYGQFVAGDCQEDIGKTITQLQQRGLRSMIACPVEEDVGQNENGGQKYDQCAAKALECIQIASMFQQDLPKIQIKISGKIQPDILVKLGEIQEPDILPVIRALSNRMKGAQFQIPDLLKYLFTAEEICELEKGIERLRQVGTKAAANNVMLLVDAEYTYLNPGISLLALALMDAFNRNKPFIWNTYQCYLKKALENISRELKIARQLDVHFGAKIVRGAYLSKERTYAREKGTSDPTNESLEATANMYLKVADFLLDNLQLNSEKIQVVFATHNENAVSYLTRRLSCLGIPQHSKHVCFAQLFGMCDQITYPLAHKGYTVYKSMPYGAVDDVLPYLHRRAMENKDVLRGTRKEVQLLKSELKHRLNPCH